MRRRPRIDLGQGVNEKEAAQLERKSKRWAERNKGRPEMENPFLAAIKPDHDNYGDPSETADQLKARLDSLEFGNYPGYHNYRNKASTLPATGDNQEQDKSSEREHAAQQQEEMPVDPLNAGPLDERLGLMKDEWFRGKRVLDIGCNRGHITYAIAKLFSPQFILGIDIDLKIIHMANRDLQLHLDDGLLKQNDLFRLERACNLFSSAHEDDGAPKEYVEDDEHLSLSSYVNVGPLATSIPSTTRDSLASVAVDPNRDRQLAADVEEPSTLPSLCSSSQRQSVDRFPSNILFVEHNYVLARDELVDRQSPCFDTIVCLSVTKWIHLNYRDEGLKRFLKRIHRHLKPSGLLVLEAQPYDNYYRKKGKNKLSDRLRANYYSIKFRPEQIDEFLLSKEVGFREIIFSTTIEHECAGFKRPLKVFLK